MRSLAPSQAAGTVGGIMSTSILSLSPLPPALEGVRADVGIVLGSGLGGLVDRVEVERRIPWSDLPGMPVPTVPGHGGQLILATLGGVRLAIQSGRVHLYEGHSASAVTAGVRLMAGLGVKSLILTNAAGAINRLMAVGDWMMLTDHLNLTGESPLSGGPNFIDMSEVYARRLRSVFTASAAACGVTLHEGVYAGVRGPQYETPAEIRMFDRLGADAVGMSTVLEAILARALGMEVAGFSCLTNWAAGIAGPLSHGEVVDTGKAAAEKFVGVLELALRGLRSKA